MTQTTKSEDRGVLENPLLMETRAIPTKLKGKVWKLPNNVNTESIMPTAAHMGGYSLEKLKAGMLDFYDPEFGPNLKTDDIIVGGTNFGCSSSRPAPIWLKRFGLGVVIAESVSQIFFRNCLAFGLPVLVCPGITQHVNKGDTMEVDIETGIIKDVSNGREFKATPLPKPLLDIVKTGNIVKLFKEEHRIQ